MSWQKAIILNENESVRNSWDGNCERHIKTVVPKKGIIRTKYVQKTSKETHKGTLVLTNQRLLWIERRGMFSKTYRASFGIDLLSLQGISVGGLFNAWVSIVDDCGEYIFHLKGVGKKESELFRDMILRQVEKLKSETRKVSVIQKEKEIITKEVVMIVCEYCRGLVPQTSLKCPNCGANRK